MFLHSIESSAIEDNNKINQRLVMSNFCVHIVIFPRMDDQKYIYTMCSIDRKSAFCREVRAHLRLMKYGRICVPMRIAKRIVSILMQTTHIVHLRR